MTVDGKEYDTLKEAVDAAKPGSLIILGKDVAESISVRSGQSLAIDGDGHTVEGNIVVEIPKGKSTVVNISNTNFHGTSNAKYGVISQDQEAGENKGSVELQLTSCEFDGFANKGLYVTNTTKLHLVDCTFKNCGSATMDNPNTIGDYIVDLNLIGVKDVDVLIDGCTFEGNQHAKSCIAIKKRGGKSDENASDIPKLEEASVKSCVIRNCSFEHKTKSAVPDLKIGVSTKTEGKVNTSARFRVLLENNTSDVMCIDGVDEFQSIIPAGQKGIKLPLGHIGKCIETNNSAGFKSSLEDAEVAQISLTGPFDINEALVCNHYIEILGNQQLLTTTFPKIKSITLNGGGILNGMNMRSSTDNTKWNSAYHIHCYTGEVDIIRSEFNGMNAGILVNGGTCRLLERIDLSGNTFGGVEVSKGKAEGLSASVLDLTNAELYNMSEAPGKPTIWIDGTTEDIGKIEGLTPGHLFDTIYNDQKQYYMRQENVPQAE